MTKDTLKNLIRKNYGTVSNFARKHQANRYDLQKFFARKSQDTKEMAQYLILASQANDQGNAGDIVPEKLERLRNEIYAMGGVEAFCTVTREEGHDFYRASVFQILEGRRKKMSKVVKKLFEYFEIE